jgi:hypothetical protein
MSCAPDCTRLRRARRRYKAPPCAVDRERHGETALGRSAMRQLWDILRRAADTPATVPPSGEQTGKEYFAALCIDEPAPRRPLRGPELRGSPSGLIEVSSWPRTRGFTGRSRAPRGLRTGPYLHPVPG